MCKMVLAVIAAGGAKQPHEDPNCLIGTLLHRFSDPH